jgi:hypothetical protein
LILRESHLACQFYYGSWASRTDNCLFSTVFLADKFRLFFSYSCSTMLTCLQVPMTVALSNQHCALFSLALPGSGQRDNASDALCFCSALLCSVAVTSILLFSLILIFIGIVVQQQGERQETATEAAMCSSCTCT